MNISIKDLLQCTFNLSRTEVKVLLRLLDVRKFHLRTGKPPGRKSSGKHGWLSIGDISPGIDLDRSIIQRSLAMLLKKGLVIREHSNLKSGGFQYVYLASDKHKLKSMLLGKSRQFSSMVKTTVAKW